MDLALPGQPVEYREPNAMIRAANHMRSVAPPD
jgi:hypothetical protein